MLVSLKVSGKIISKEFASKEMFAQIDVMRIITLCKKHIASLSLTDIRCAWGFHFPIRGLVETFAIGFDYSYTCGLVQLLGKITNYFCNEKSMQRQVLEP